MKVDLLKHNEEAYEKLKEELKNGKRKIAIAHATGTGKSYLIAKLCEDYSEKRKLILLPSKYISEQMQKLLVKYGIKNTDIMLYQKLIKMSDEDIAAMGYQIIILDEYHHDTSVVWGEKTKCLIESHPEAIVFGTSATPVRSDGVDVIDELFDGNCASELLLSQAIVKKIVPIPTYVSAMYSLDDELSKLEEKVKNSTNTKEEKRAFYEKINAMRSQIEKAYGMPIIINKHMKDREGKYIVFCKNKKHLKEIKDIVVGWFMTAGFKNINSYVVHSSYENKDAEYQAFCNDNSHSVKLLFAVNMLNEGLHLENISGVLLLRPTFSKIIWHQQIGRCIEANNTGNPVIIDATNNFQSIGLGIGLLRDIKEEINKEKEGNKCFDDSDFLDIDTFFITGYVQEIQALFAKVEEQLRGSWDMYITALKQYKSREGDCKVPIGHFEIFNGMNVSLGKWVRNMRKAKEGRGRCVITDVQIDELNKLGFIWDAHKYSFETNVSSCIKFYETYNKNPSSSSKDKKEKKLGQFIEREKKNIKNNEHYPDWKLKLLEQIPLFFEEKESGFDRFYNNILRYKEKYGHTNIKYKDTIYDYNIGFAYNTIFDDYKHNKLTIEQINRLKEVGVDVTTSRYDKHFRRNMELARNAVLDGVVLSSSNRIYKGIDFYE